MLHAGGWNDQATKWYSTFRTHPTTILNTNRKKSSNRLPFPYLRKQREGRAENGTAVSPPMLTIPSLSFGVFTKTQVLSSTLWRNNLQLQRPTRVRKSVREGVTRDLFFVTPAFQQRRWILKHTRRSSHTNRQVVPSATTNLASVQKRTTRRTPRHSGVQDLVQERFPLAGIVCGRAITRLIPRGY